MAPTAPPSLDQQLPASAFSASNPASALSASNPAPALSTSSNPASALSTSSNPAPSILSTSSNPSLSALSTSSNPSPSALSTSTNPAPAPSTARIRENQRRSRARRKEYLQELEQKLRTCKEAGVRASVDMQLAAREVAEENKRLRRENGELMREGEALRREIGRMRVRVQASSADTTTLTEGDSDFYTELNAAQPEWRAEGPGVVVGQEDEMVLGDDTSSCEYAAHIITSMRADVSADDVRAELGCGGGGGGWPGCTVENSKLFVAVDRYTG